MSDSRMELTKSLAGKLFLILLFSGVAAGFCANSQVSPEQGENAVPPEEIDATQKDLEYWLKNMLVYHKYTWDEAARVSGLRVDELKERAAEFGIERGVPRASGAPVLLPYPGGRHPRIGFLEGAIRPQRGTKASVFPPWEDSGYVVIDLPEAIFSNLGLTYLAHTHIPTIWDEKGISLKNIDWSRNEDGSLEFERVLPNKIAFGASIQLQKKVVHMELWLRNGTSEPLTDLRTQICVMTKGAPAFNAQTNENKLLREPVAAVESEEGARWILTAWEKCGRVWANEDVPCFHSDPVLPDTEPGETVRVRGWLWFYEGEDINKEIERALNAFGLQ